MRRLVGPPNARWVVCCLAILLAGCHSPPYDPWVQGAHYELTAKLDLDDVRAACGTDVGTSCSLPAPRNDAAQQTYTTTVESPWPWTLETDAHGNPAVCLRPPAGDASGASSGSTVVVRFQLRRMPHAAELSGLPPAATGDEATRVIGYLLPADRWRGDLKASCEWSGNPAGSSAPITSDRVAFVQWPSTGGAEQLAPWCESGGRRTSIPWKLSWVRLATED